MAIPLLLLVGASAAAAIIADFRRARRVFYVFKPLTTGLILLLALTRTTGSYQAWICAGIVLSLAGDAFLMLPGDRFNYGLASFFLAHLCFIAAFTGRASAALTLSLMALFLAYAIALLVVLWPHLAGKRIQVLLYAAILSGMGWRAGEAWFTLHTPATLAAFAGAVLFILSDSALAWRRFVRPFRAAQALILGTYYTALVLIALSV